MKKYYVCEGCGCIHKTPDAIFVIAGKEMCVECAPYQRIEIPECGFGCQHCDDSCPLLLDIEIKWNF